MTRATSLSLTIIAARLRSSGHLMQTQGSTTFNEIREVTTDSKKSSQEVAFIAYKGVQVDSHEFIDDAYHRGCRVFILESTIALTQPDAIYFQVTSGRAAWAELSALFWSDPQVNMQSLAVTGTNGKTSTVWFLKEILRLIHMRCMTAGTLGVFFDDTSLGESLTTPDPDQLFACLRRARDTGIDCLAMEASSHALSHARLGPIKFSGAIFTSFSRDHLDFHGDMHSYFASKALLFYQYLSSGSPSLVHSQIDWSLDVGRLVGPLYTFGPADGKDCDFTYSYDDVTAQGCLLTLKSPHTEQTGYVPFFADFSIANFAGAYFLSELVLGFSLPAEKWAELRQIPGRMELVPSPHSKCPTVIVDYAHTPDALDKALATLRIATNGMLWVVFGCGGDRDKGKRPEMAGAAEKHADHIIVTSDNPRNENPEAIIDDVLAGLTDRSKLSGSFISREEAIAFAVHNAGHEDVVLIAGKGHENYQILGDNRLSFDDRQVAAAKLKERI